VLDLCDEVLDADEIKEGDANPDEDDDKGFILFVFITLLDTVWRLIFWYEVCRPLAAAPGEEDRCKSTARCDVDGFRLSIGIVFTSGL